MTTPTDPARIERILDAVYAWSRRTGYRGYNKHDGLNSPLLRLLLGHGRWPRILAIQAVMRFPWNLRPVLGVPRTENPKGLALFAQGLLDRHRLHGRDEPLDEARQLLDRLLALRSDGDWSGGCWGYPYPWQDPGFFASSRSPNAVVTCFVSEALLDGYGATGDARYLEAVGEALGFLLKDLPVLADTAEELCLGYVPVPMTMRVMDVSILIASVVARHARLAGTDAHLPMGRRLATYVVRRQTPEGAWFYTDPPEDSRIRHDNYHTGFILDALARWMEATGEDAFASAYGKGLAFYAAHHFNADGSPRWMSDVDYPHDIHGAAQGILTFARHQHDYPGLARRVAGWAIDRMYHPDGRFFYQERRHYRRRFTLLRWCNGWMARALSRLLLETSDREAN